MAEDVRQFPCTQCGAKVEFAPGTDALQCPYCGNQTEIPTSDEAIEEQDFKHAAAADIGEGAETEEVSSVRCESCAALVEPSASAEAFPCPYCGSSIVATAKSQRLIKPQALLAFKIDRNHATDVFRKWIGGLWYAPNALKKLARVEGRLQGLYAPYWTYDADTVSQYKGKRGVDYMVTKGDEDGTWEEVETRWTSVSGTLRVDIDDMLVVGSASLPRDLAEALEPWDLGDLVGYADQYLSGFLAERYQVDVRTGWVRAQERMEVVIRGKVKRAIGGDRQLIDKLDTDHSNITFKHILLPMWICSYRYGKKIYRFLVNARTGEVQGQRPRSWIKITLTAISIAAAIYLFVYLTISG